MGSKPIWTPVQPDFLAPPDGQGDAKLDASVEGPTRRGDAGLTSWQRRAQLVAILVTLVWLLYWYRNTAMAMEAIWSRSGTFAHGYLVAPISLWLVWRKREALCTLPLRPSIWGLLGCLASGLAWLLAQLASVDSVEQFALIGMLISAVWAVAGTAVARVLVFPLGFLFFCVPFGEFLFPTMMDWTANFVVWALRLTGVPVYVEGRSLVIPSGHWQVVEGCSGVRYLIASIVVGSLYSYLNYRSLTRRLTFTVMAVVAPIFANWLRAYGIVLLGHVSDNKLATGVDHLVYGWVFFGIVMLGLFWVGARWQEPLLNLGSETIKDPGEVKSSATGGLWIGGGAACLLLISLWPLFLDHVAAQDRHSPVALVLPEPEAGWHRTESGSLPVWSPRYSGMAASADGIWVKSDSVVGLYIGYYRNQTQGKELINSENRVLRNKDEEWSYVSRGLQHAVFEGTPVTLWSTEIQGAPGRLLVWHLFWIGGMTTSDDYVGKLFLAFNRLLGRGDDSAVVMIYALEAERGREGAEKVLDAFIKDMGSSINEALRATAER